MERLQSGGKEDLVSTVFSALSLSHTHTHSPLSLPVAFFVLLPLLSTPSGCLQCLSRKEEAYFIKTL